MGQVLNDDIGEDGPSLRIVLLNDDVLEDTGEEYDVFDFGGMVPNAGDWIHKPGVLKDLDSSVLGNRGLWEVVRRVFQAKDHGGEYVVLVVRERQVRDSEAAII